MNDLAYAVDIFGLLNKLNEKLQGKNRFAFDSYKHVKDFIDFLELTRNNVEQGVIDNNLPATFEREELLTSEQRQRYLQILTNLRNSLLSRFDDFRSVDYLFECMNNLLSVEFDPDVNPILYDRYSAEAIDQFKIVQNNEQLRKDYEAMSPFEFFKSVSWSEFSEIKYIALICFVIFGSTYDCESLFSAMNQNKSAVRSSLCDTSLDSILRINSTNIQLDFEKIAAEN